MTESGSMWSHERRFRTAVVVVGMVVLGVCAFRAIYKFGDGDFKLHWEFGRRFIAGEILYAGRLHTPYPPFWAMAHAPVAWLPLAVAKALLVPIGVGALVALLWLVRRLAAESLRVAAPQLFWVTTLALLLASRFVIRDMAEVGVNTMLVMLTWLAIYLWRQGHDAVAGASLGLAVALKCTPAIFAAYFLWKRQWRMAGFTAAAALLFTVAPVLRQGPESYAAHMSRWTTNVWQGVSSSDPATGVAGAEPVQNMALRPALARYLMTLSREHPGRVDHPLYFDVFDLPPHAAGVLIRIVLLALVIGFLWWSRAAVVRRDDPRLLWEVAALSILMLLLSPITWGQHCVALLPPCFFVAAIFIARGGMPRWMIALLALYILCVPVLSRDVVGRAASLLLASYHLETAAMLALLAVVLGCSRLQREAAR